MALNQGQFRPTGKHSDDRDWREGGATGTRWAKDAIKHPTMHRTALTMLSGPKCQ